jgi:uncharacterized membrane protein
MNRIKLLCSLGMLMVSAPGFLPAQETGIKETTMETTIGKMHPQELRRQLQDERSPDMSRRRLIILLALIGMAAMVAVTLFQMGLVHHLPDPPFRIFDSPAVNSSDRAYKFGVPDGTVDILMLSVMILLTATGGANRAESLWIVPVGVLLLALAQAGGAVFYLVEMTRMKLVCLYCVTTALAHLAILPLSFPEAWRALSGAFRS